MTPVGPFNVVPVVPAIEKLYRFSGRFVVVSGHEHFTETMELRLTGPRTTLVKTRLPHDTYLGWGVAHTGVEIAKTDASVAMALQHRQLGCREPQIFGLCEHLYRNQREHFQSYIPWFIRQMEERHRYFQSVASAYEEALVHYDDPHPKRRARRTAMESAMHPDGLMTRRVWSSRPSPVFDANLKTGEKAKPGKPGRITVDCKVPASMQSFVMVNAYKSAMALYPFEFEDGLVVVVKRSSHTELKNAYSLLLHSPHRVVVLVFSDDSTARVTVNGQHHYFDIDISSCDKSHGRGVFDAFIAAAPSAFHDECLGLVQHGLTPLRIRSVHNPRIKAVIRPIEPTLYSGMNITTTINNIANLAIARNIISTRASTSVDVQRAAASVGYIVTTVPARTIEQVQFLKTSPVILPTGELHPLINLGVFLRASGNIKGDLPGSGDLRARAEQHQSNLLSGFYSNVDTPLVNAMRSRLPAPTTHAPLDEFKLKTARVTLTTEEFLRRYTGISVHELYDFFTSGFGDITSNASISTILQADYGLRTAGYDDYVATAAVPLTDL